MAGRSLDDDIHRRLASAEGDVTLSPQALHDQLRTVRRLELAITRSRSIRRTRRFCAALMLLAAAAEAACSVLVWRSAAYIGPAVFCVALFAAAARWRHTIAAPYRYSHDQTNRIDHPLPELEAELYPTRTVVAPKGTAKGTVTEAHLASRSRLRPLAELETELALAKHTLRRAQEENYPSVTARRRRYRDDVERLIGTFQRESRRYRRVHNGLQSLIMVGSAVTTTVSALDIEGLTWQHVTTIAISLSITLAAAFTGYYKYRERSFFLQQTADAIEEQLNAFEYGVGDYARYDDDQAKALAHLTGSVEALRNEQRRRQQQLDQPADQATSSGSTTSAR